MNTTTKTLKENEMNFPIIRGITADGKEVFFTGRPGSFFVSENRDEAFTAFSLEGARRKATVLNEATCLHGIRFVAISPEVQAQAA